MDTYVTHSSLSSEQRRQAEQAFSERADCVIIATSVLELGVGVGDLDYVIQIDASRIVGGFLQRMSRAGRRSGTRRNYLFLTTSESASLHAEGLIQRLKPLLDSVKQGCRRPNRRTLFHQERFDLPGHGAVLIL